MCDLLIVFIHQYSWWRININVNRNITIVSRPNLSTRRLPQSLDWKSSMGKAQKGWENNKFVVLLLFHDEESLCEMFSLYWVLTPVRNPAYVAAGIEGRVHKWKMLVGATRCESMAVKYKKAELSQRWPRDARYVGALKIFESPWVRPG